MTALFEQTLETIRSFQLPGLPRREGEIHPFYGGLSNANLPASICRWLDCTLPFGLPLDAALTAGLPERFRNVILLVVDGMRLDLFGEYLRADRALRGVMDGLQFAPLTSIAPSTTSAALTTLWTGRQPAEHGIIGYELFLKEFGFIANMITHSVASFTRENNNLVKAGFEAQQFLPVPTLTGHFRQKGVTPHAMQHISLTRSGLTDMLFSGVESHAYRTQSDMWARVEDILESGTDQKQYIYIYWGDLDTQSHLYGPEDRQIRNEWEAFAALMVPALECINKMSHGETLFILTADHGQIPTPIDSEMELRNHPDLIRHLVMLPSGESRLPYLFVKHGHEEWVRNYLTSHWEGRFAMYPSADVLESGLLGSYTPHAATIDRMGDLVVFPEGNAYWWWVNKENRLLGRHGGLSAQEMLVPLVLLPL
jgi:predicted AlkP superfamily pyrophosphatase or phosphodiesterase